MAFGPDGRLYVTELEGRVVVIGAPGSPPQPVATGLANPLGLAWRGNELFVSVKGGILAYLLEGGQLTGEKLMVRGLPFGRYQNNNVILLPNGDFLLGVGAPCDACNPQDPRSGTVLRFHKDWSYAGVVMRGIHNPYGLALRPTNAAAYVTINGQDNLGPEEPADHMLRVADGIDVGWPRCWPSAKQPGQLKGDCKGVARPLAVFAAHTSADGFAFYDGRSFPAEYWDNAFVAEWGEVASAGTIGRRVVRVVLTGAKDNEHGTVTDFATGLDRPLAIAVAPSDGGLLVADFGSGPRNGRIIEIAPNQYGASFGQVGALPLGR